MDYILGITFSAYKMHIDPLYAMKPVGASHMRKNFLGLTWMKLSMTIHDSSLTWVYESRFESAT